MLIVFVLIYFLMNVDACFKELFGQDPSKLR